MVERRRGEGALLLVRFVYGCRLFYSIDFFSALSNNTILVLNYSERKSQGVANLHRLGSPVWLGYPAGGEQNTNGVRKREFEL